MADTAQALLAIIEDPQPGLVHLDSNADEAYRHDQRLAGGTAHLPPLLARLRLLRAV